MGIRNIFEDFVSHSVHTPTCRAAISSTLCRNISRYLILSMASSRMGMRITASSSSPCSTSATQSLPPCAMLKETEMKLGYCLISSLSCCRNCYHIQLFSEQDLLTLILSYNHLYPCFIAYSIILTIVPSTLFSFVFIFPSFALLCNCCSTPVSILDIICSLLIPFVVLLDTAALKSECPHHNNTVEAFFERFFKAAVHAAKRLRIVWNSRLHGGRLP